MSEAATSLIDRRLQLNIVPFTDVIHMSSPTFHYDHGDRKANDPRKPSPRPLPAKIGSFQCFLNDFNDASVFLRNHPFPPDAFYSNSRSLSKKRSTVFSCLGSNEDDDEENQQEMQHQDPPFQHFQGKKVFQWTRKLQQQFKREFESLAIMDYLIRNTGNFCCSLQLRGREGISKSYINRIRDGLVNGRFSEWYSRPWN